MKPAVIAHFFSVDPLIHSLIAQFPKVDVLPRDTYFSDLVDSIISQQLSEKAGATIVKRFYELVGDQPLTPEVVLSLPDEKIREVGTSWSKVSYIKNIARGFVDGTIDVAQLPSWSDEVVVEHLTQIKGVGQWTAEMFLMFTLGREDVFSYGDVGLQNAIQKLYNLKKKPTRKQMEKITKKWKPYRTYASKLLWKSLDNE